tara:strand:- start:2962 stop:3108 length:147 start_codon:yes stop_codon:yes gene_type:complete
VEDEVKNMEDVVKQLEDEDKWVVVDKTTPCYIKDYSLVDEAEIILNVY